MTSWLTDISSKRRDKLLIISEILEISKDGSLKTQIMYRANLSFAQLVDYLRFLEKNRLMKKVNNADKDTYYTTEKGMDFLQRHHEIMELLSEATDARCDIQSPPERLLRRP
ncbi:MAG: winged helix-turn-helix domain-containing protein [Candidatus Bathyarchaeota archaeon]|nr:winged helix-turn-helix domain-containing protein [Candidatus Bathyarchaeota archaeon]